MHPDTRPEDRVSLSRQNADLLRLSSRAIAGFARDDEPLRLTLTRQNGEQTEMTVPGRALHVVAQVLDDMAKAGSLTLAASSAELTTHQAAAIMRVSRPYLIKLLDTGKLPYRKVGTHRRILSEDVAAYVERERAARRRALDEMAAEAQRLGLYE